MRSKIIKSGSLLLMVAMFSLACRKEKDTDAGGTATQALAGEWWVQVKVNNAPIAPGYFKILTYNTAENTANRMWIDDHENIWPFKFKMDVDPVNRTFAAQNATSTYSNITVKMNNGKILDKVTKGPVSKAVTDSIHFEAEFSDDPGTTYQFSGYKRTGWPEDDH